MSAKLCQSSRSNGHLPSSTARTALGGHLSLMQGFAAQLLLADREIEGHAVCGWGCMDVAQQLDERYFGKLVLERKTRRALTERNASDCS